MSGEKSCRRPSRLSKSRSLGVFTLILALFIFQVTVFVIDKVFSEDTASLAVASDDSMPAVGKSMDDAHKEELFEFDPNTITPDSLCMLGLSPRQAQTIINYRSKGGHFNNPEDFARMYVVSNELYGRIRPFINIKSGDLAVKEVPMPKKEHSDQSEPKTQKGLAEEVESKRESNRKNLVVELNGADSSELVTLYGIGPYYAHKIMQYRERLGGFHSVEQLMEIGGIDSTRFEGLSKSVVVDPLKIRTFSLDTAGKRFLVSHPYIGAYAARGIMLLREKLGKSACTIENLIKEKVIAPQMAERLWPYIR